MKPYIKPDIVIVQLNINYSLNVASGAEMTGISVSGTASDPSQGRASESTFDDEETEEWTQW